MPFNLRAIAALLCLLALSLPAAAQNKLALVLGNSDYASLPKLANPANDARLLAKQLETAGFTVSLQLDQTQNGMRSALSDFVGKVEKAGAGTVALFYYAGHGVQIDGVNYLAPVDVKGDTASEVVLGSLSASDVLRTLEVARAKVNVIVLDACRNNPFKSASRSFSSGLARVEAPAGSLVAYSTAPGQVALDGTGQNSPYAEALSKHIATPGVALETVFRNVRIEVSEKTSGSQVPWEETSLTQEVMLAGQAPAKPDAGASAGQTPAPGAGAAGSTTPDPATPQPPTGNKDIDSARAYHVAVAQNTIEAYDAYLREFPNAKETPQAMRNLEMLNDEANWRRAHQQNTVGAYRIYLNLHPGGAYKDEANSRLLALAQPPQQPDPPVRQQPPVHTPPVYTPPPQQPPPPQNMVEAHGFDLFGQDGDAIRNMSYQQCSDACRDNQGCVAVSYRGDLRRCYMKTSVDLLVRNKKSSVAVKPHAQANLRTSNFELAPQFDIPGFDIGSLRLDSAQDCLRVCEARSDCRAFSFVTTTNQCWLKSGYRRSKAAKAVVSGYR